jgi:hypothetical protein
MAERSKRDRDVHVYNVTGASKYWIGARRGEIVVDPMSSQRDVIRLAKAVAINQRCELVIHGKNGKIRRKTSYGNDSPRRKG